MSGIKTPLTYGDAIEMATGHCRATGRLTHDERKCPACASLAKAFMAVDQASREQARADIASGVYPLPHKHVPCPEPYARCLAEEFEVGHGACHQITATGLCGEAEFAPVHEPAEEGA